MNLSFIYRITQNISVTKWSNGKKYLQRILNMLYYFKHKEMHLDHSGFPHDTCCRVWCGLFSSFINRDTQGFGYSTISVLLSISNNLLKCVFSYDIGSAVFILHGVYKYYWSYTGYIQKNSLALLYLSLDCLEVVFKLIIHFQNEVRVCLITVLRAIDFCTILRWVQIHTRKPLKAPADLEGDIHQIKPIQHFWNSYRCDDDNAKSHRTLFVGDYLKGYCL